MKTFQRRKSVKWLLTAAVIVANLLCWAVPSDLAYNVAQHRQILLGRYTVERTTTLILLAVITPFVLRGIWAPKHPKTSRQKRLELFKTITVTISILISIICADIALRIIQKQPYVGNKIIYHRTPNTTEQGVIKDIPPAFFSYPLAPPGYPDFPYSLTVDRRGFRNKTDLETYDAVVLGDSFAEGSHVSDEHAWPVLLAQKTNLAIYNLAVSGGSPLTYLEILKRFGLALRPRLVICMLYEGNDFRAENFEKPKDDKPHISFKALLDSSPLRQSLKKAMIRYLGPINSNRPKSPVTYQQRKTLSYPPSHPLYPVAWLPLAVPDNPNARYYAFKVKRLLAHFETKQQTRNSPGTEQTLQRLLELKQICDANEIRLLVVFAPDKPHVLLPLVKDTISPHQLHAFVRLKLDNPPPPQKLLEQLLARLSNHETIVQEFCTQHNIEFLSLTDPLRQRIAQATQAYFTYDQHWTPPGHRIVAETLAHYLAAHPAP